MGTIKRIERLEEEITLLKDIIARRCPSLETILRRRGFNIFQKQCGEYLLLPEPKFIDSYYENLKKYSFRLFLRDVIKQKGTFSERDVARYATKEVTKTYIEYLLETGIIEKSNDGFALKRRVKTFGDTLEWFMAEVLKREFAIEAMWSVKFRGRQVGGDYDLIASLNNDLLYMEVKSSPPRQVYDKEVRAFLQRREELCPDLAIFFMDTHLRMKDKMVPMFEEELRGLFETEKPVKRLHSEIFIIENNLFISNSKPSIETNMETIFFHYYRRRFK